MAPIRVRLSTGRREGAHFGPAGTQVAGAPVHWLDVTPKESDDSPCTIRSLDVRARVSGLFAEVTQTIVVVNLNRRPISAPFTFPLPDRAVVCGHALDIDGQMIEGVVVEQEKARVAFETEQRRGADPGLVEAVRGNVYRTRVYPVPACGTRKVMLRYVAPLLLTGSGAALDLPMPAEHLERRTMCLEVEQLDCPKPVLHGVGTHLLEEAQGLWVVRYEDRDLAPGTAVRVALPQLPASLVQLECDEEGTVWFSASQDAPEATEEPRALTSLTVLWDASGSRSGTPRAQEVDLLGDICRESTFETYRLVVFADHVREVSEFDNIYSLQARLSTVPYDGATNLVELSQTVAALSETDDEGSAYVLFSDGFDTLSDQPFELPGSINILAILSGTAHDAEALRQACHGLVFDFEQAPKDAAEFARAVSSQNPNRLSDVQGTGIADVCDASVPSARRIIIGRLLAEQTTISLDGGQTSLALDAADAREGKTIARAWAARRAALLSPRANDYADELLALGRRFGVVSPATSLLVLESLEQWLRYDIEPPKSWERMHKLWARNKRGEMRLSGNQWQEDDHRRVLANDWSALLRWWEREFGKPTGEPGTCPQCGSRLIPRLPFCPHCGLRIPRPEEEDAFDDERTEAVVAMATSADSLSESYAEDEEELGDYIPDEPRPTTARYLRDGTEPTDGAFNLSEGAPRPSTARRSSDMLRRSIFAVPGDASDARADSVHVSVRAWSPDMPYLKRLDRAVTNDVDTARRQYYREREEYANSPSFFLDCASWFMTHDDRDFGLQVLGNLAEMRIEDAALLRVMAWRLREAGRLEQALMMLRRVLRLRGEDSQSYRDVALVLDDLARLALAQGDEDAARRYATEAGELYRKLALTPWERRPLAISLFAVEEYNVLRSWAEAQSWRQAPELPSLGEDLEGVLACDLRITLAWDADETDVDIHVTEPSGEEAYYGHPLTYRGGRVSEDITDGFGPELYEIRRAEQGVYTIRAHYFASHQQAVFGPATCTLTVYTDWGKPEQAQQITSMRLEREREMVLVSTASYGDAAVAQAHAAEEPGEQLATQHTVAAGMDVDEVRELLGEPSDTGPDGSPSQAAWTWQLEDGRKLVVHFVEGKVERVFEQMPWGEETILSQ